MARDGSRASDFEALFHWQFEFSTCGFLSRLDPHAVRGYTVFLADESNLPGAASSTDVLACASMCDREHLVRRDSVRHWQNSSPRLALDRWALALPSRTTLLTCGGSTSGGGGGGVDVFLFPLPPHARLRKNFFPQVKLVNVPFLLMLRIAKFPPNAAVR